MKKISIFFLICLLIYISWPSIREALGDKTSEHLKEIQSTIEEKDVQGFTEDAVTAFNQMIINFEQWIQPSPNDSPPAEEESVEKPALSEPDSQTISVYNFEIGEKKAEVENTLGSPQRITSNEYGSKWHAYHDNYHHFIMISYDENELINGIYTNQDLITSKNGFQMNMTKEEVTEIFGEPISAIRKGITNYQYATDSNYALYEVDDSYLTVFYDIHENNQVTAIQLIAKELELNKVGFYGEKSAALKEGFEFQLFDLTNAERVNYHLPTLTWDDPVRQTARDHSADMAVNNYFGHDNLKGESPFDRMNADDILFRTAGENLAYGQFSSIFAHEGLMNSAGHRKNILKEDYQLLGVGVAFNDDNQPYFTENFYTKR
ncbi:MULTISPECIES: CAP domain-containing protein [Cytobacillus]|uniref:CAP domain-containing protein n=1 Tax=Cytobacillus TaxID=2675230 RepID=UPI00203A3AAF|nr:CAP domain-containing protein [Cytobacillus kochii]MCM3321138.1 CAP domain-containing protein [Cytobacillus kochii]MCM3344029.1 CAP domain-containing protein [Cytobacillus kochii]MDM5207874.1 CAP domain-containing protein [Cytobacillus kochii]